jgi:hypothetical protein
MPISWAMALKLYAKESGNFILPKKGSDAYDKVKKIQSGTEMKDEYKLKRKEKKVAKEPVAKAMTKAKGRKRSESLSSQEESERAMKDKAVEMPPSVKNDTKMIDVPEIDKRKRVLKNPESIPEQKGKGGVTRTGKTVQENDLNYLENNNIGEGQDISAQLPGQKEKIEKALKKKPAKKLVTVGNGEEKTIDGMKTDDAVAIEGGKTQFSFQALRNRLLC